MQRLFCENSFSIALLFVKNEMIFENASLKTRKNADTFKSNMICLLGGNVTPPPLFSRILSEDDGIGAPYDLK